MKYPTLHEQATSRRMIDEFRGYNHNLRIGEGEFYDMKNMSSSNYPVLSPRGVRGVYAAPGSPKGMIAKDSLCYVKEVGGSLYFCMNEYDTDLGIISSENKGAARTLVSMGAYVIIMPDKMWINTADLSEHGNIEAKMVTAAAATVSFELCKNDGTVYADTTVSATAPADPANADLWIDTSSVPHTLKQYSTTSAVWVAIATTYVKISAPNIAAPFKQYDGVTISGCTAAGTADLNATYVLQAAYHDPGDQATGRAEGADDYLVVIGILDSAASQTTSVTITRTMPNMDFIIESENRLWGCRYGIAANGEVVNEIYACKLGDFKNWNCFMGISTDSYVASCGTDGQFTGAITHLGYPLFFKEGFLHKIYGNYPSNYQIQTTACRGVQKGCSKSLAIVNEVLYYKSRQGICAYDGSLPTEISVHLGDVIYSDAVACAHGNKYYVSMKDTEGLYHLFVYDAAKNMWHKEDNTQAFEFCSCREELYFIDSADQKIKTIFGSGTKDTGAVSWMAETGVIGTDSPDKKYISRLAIRMALAIGTRVRLYAQYDSSGQWEHLFSMSGKDLRSFAIPVRPKRCDHLRLRFEGEGEAKIYSIAQTVENGSDY